MKLEEVALGTKLHEIDPALDKAFQEELDSLYDDYFLNDYEVNRERERILERFNKIAERGF